MDPDELSGAVDAHAEHGALEWGSDPDFAREALFQHVGAGLLTGEGLLRSPDAPTVSRLGRNLLTEAEHATALRSARDLMSRAADPAEHESANALAGAHPDDHGVQYLRDNADSLASQLATKQAKAAQQLLDSYGEVAKLRPDRAQLDAQIPPGARIDQARWLREAEQKIGQQLESVPAGIAAPLRKQLSALGDGTDPAQWFERAQALSDDLTRARAAAGRAAKASDQVDGDAHQTALDAAHSFLASGLAQENLWGPAAVSEQERASGYARRVGDHLGDFEEHFTSQVGGAHRADPGKFLTHLTGDDATAGPSRRALASTLDAARTTAGAAERFGKGDAARSILDAADALDAGSSQGRAIQAAIRGGKAQDPEAAARAGLDSLAGSPLAQGLPTDQDRAGVYRASSAFTRAADAASKQGAADLLSPKPQGARSALAIAAPSLPTVNALNFDSVRDHIDKMANDPRYFGEVMGASFGRLPEVAPEVFAAVSRQAAQVVNYLAAVAPGGSSGGPFAERVPVSEDELWDFNQRFAAVTDPEFVKTELRQGSLSSQAVESYQACNEKQYLRLQMDVFEKLQQLKAAGVPVPSQAREQLDVLLDLDGGGDPALTWQVAERAQAADQAHHQRLVTKGAQGGAGGGMTSGALATLNNGASAIAQTG